MGQEDVFSTNQDLANILGDMDFDFESSYVLDFFGIPNSQISRFQISKIPEIWPGPSLGPVWARLGPGLGPAWAQLGPGLSPVCSRLGPSAEPGCVPGGPSGGPGGPRVGREAPRVFVL